jgi:hypothetical protein
MMEAKLDLFKKCWQLPVTAAGRATIEAYFAR